jgi:hypothetical protein
MAVPTASQRPIRRWRVIVFAVVDALLTLLFGFFFQGFLALLEPWINVLPASTLADHTALSHWHATISGAMIGLLLAGSLIGLVWQGQKRPLLAQFFVICLLTFGIEGVIVDPTTIIFGPIITLVILGLFVLTYPTPRALVSFSREGAWSRLLLLLAALTVLCVAPDVWHNVIQGANTHFVEARASWYLTVLVEVLLVGASVLAASRRPGWVAMGMLTGITCLYLGAAALSVSSTWGTIGGILGLLGGLGYIGATVYEMRQTKQVAQVSAPETTPMASSQV